MLIPGSLYLAQETVYEVRSTGRSLMAIRPRGILLSANIGVRIGGVEHVSCHYFG